VGYSTVKKINDGTNRKDFSLKYPLNKNKIENQKSIIKFLENVVSTISS
jgi:hypothetical protein